MEHQPEQLRRPSSRTGFARQPIAAASPRAFTLLELLLVILILVLVTAFVVPAVGATLVAMRLRTAADMAVNQIASARQSAIALNRTVEVRFYRFAALGQPGEQPSDPATGKFRALQVFQYDESGLAIALTKVEQLPDGVIFDSGPLSSLLATIPKKTFKAPLDAQVALPVCGTNYTCTTYQILPGGNTSLAAGQWYITVHNQNDGDAPPSLPKNYAAIQIDPASGVVRTYRP
jgi:uncharacterized protein (TIGR02596 family)